MDLFLGRDTQFVSILVTASNQPINSLLATPEFIENLVDLSQIALIVASSMPITYFSYVQKCVPSESPQSLFCGLDPTDGPEQSTDSPNAVAGFQGGALSV